MKGRSVRAIDIENVKVQEDTPLASKLRYAGVQLQTLGTHGSV